ncbi:MAG: glycosyltransferase [Anaerolineales bacterium]|nr:glycosyltransferase [Anaerolineales bacterium]
MRILQVSPFFTPSMGGAAQVAFQLSSYLSRRGHLVTVVAGDHGVRSSRYPDNGFQQVLLPSYFSRLGFYFTPGLPTWLREHISEHDLIHLHTVRTYQNVVALSEARSRKIPVVISAHGTLPIILQRKSAKKAFDWFFGSTFRKNVCRWIAVSPMEVRQFEQAGIRRDRIGLIPNGVDLEEFSCLPRRGQFRKDVLHISSVRPLFLYLGRLHREKGLRLLLEAFERIQTKYPESALAIVGPDDGERSLLEKTVKKKNLEDRVLFSGPLYGGERLKALVDADVIASPATYEIFGLVPVEAILCGTPVVVGGYQGRGGLLQEADAVFTIPPNDASELAKTLCWIVEHPREAQEKVNKGRRYIKKNLDLQKISRELERLYDGVLAECTETNSGRI